jgi:chaperonin GroES
MIIPTSGRLVLQKIKEEETVQKGSLILPSSQPKQDRYRVVKMYESHYTSSIKLPPFEGHIVYVDKYKGVEISHEGEKYLVVNDEDIIAYEGLDGHSNVGLGCYAE